MNRLYELDDPSGPGAGPAGDSPRKRILLHTAKLAEHLAEVTKAMAKAIKYYPWLQNEVMGCSPPSVQNAIKCAQAWRAKAGPPPSP